MSFFGYHVLEDHLKAMRAKLDELAETVRFGFSRVMSQLDDVITAIDSATTDIATALETDAAAISGLGSQRGAGAPPTPDQLAKLTNIQARLTASAARAKEIGADPANPVPTATPTTTPPAST